MHTVSWWTTSRSKRDGGERDVIAILADGNMRQHPGPACPRGIGSDGIGACIMVSHVRQE
jgi:hypothetical protein